MVKVDFSKNNLIVLGINCIPQLPKISEGEQTPTVKRLLSSLENCIGIILQQKEQINQLKDEINILKGEKKRPRFEPLS